jgi:hypothetical protein
MFERRYWSFFTTTAIGLPRSQSAWRIQLLMRELNLLGGVVIPDALPEQQVKKFVHETGQQVARTS